MKSNVLGKLTGKVKYVVGIIFAVLVVINRAYSLGLDEVDFDRIMTVFLVALGVDGVEGAVATLKNGKATEKKTEPG